MDENATIFIYFHKLGKTDNAELDKHKNKGKCQVVRLNHNGCVIVEKSSYV